MAGTLAEFVDEIRERNRVLLDGRPEKDPGNFKTESNFAAKPSSSHRTWWTAR